MNAALKSIVARREGAPVKVSARRNNRRRIQIRTLGGHGVVAGELIEPRHDSTAERRDAGEGVRLTADVADVDRRSGLPVELIGIVLPCADESISSDRREPVERRRPRDVRRRTSCA
jgi:hypothetical protein